MLIGYIDSNVVLSLLLEDDHYVPSLEMWDACDKRLSSQLLEVETYVNIHRYGKTFFNEDWIAKKIQLQSQLMLDVILRPVDDFVIQKIKSNKAITGCKTLDALHLSTALYFQENSELDITIMSHDNKVKQVASKLGFTVY